MSHPPDRQQEDHQIPVEVVNDADPTALDIPPSAFHILKRGFDAHPPSIDLDELSGGRQVRNHHPDLFISRFPTDGQGGRKAVLLPDQCLAVPLETFSGEKLSNQLPILIPSFELATHQVLLGNAQHIMPLDLLADLNEFEATEP